jgi:ATP-dependent Clp protease protease subunit
MGEEEESYFSINENLREIYLIGDITEAMSSAVIPAIRQLDQSSGQINFIVSTTGGNVDAGLAMYDAILLTRNKTACYCYGICQSMGAIIIQACDQRILAPNCRYMIHNGTIGLDCSLDEGLALSKEVELLKEKNTQILSRRAKIPLAKIKKLCYSTTYMSAEECCQAGFADGILEIPRKRR